MSVIHPALRTAPDDEVIYCKRCDNCERFMAITFRNFKLKEALFYQFNKDFYVVPSSIREETFHEQGTGVISLKCPKCRKPGTTNWAEIYPSRIKGIWDVLNSCPTK